MRRAFRPSPPPFPHENIVEKTVELDQGPAGITLEISSEEGGNDSPKIFVTDINTTSPLFQKVFLNDEILVYTAGFMKTTIPVYTI